MNGSADSAPGVVELREDVPLKSGGAGGAGAWCSGGPRLILGCFATLSAAITLALFTQIYYGDYEVVPHGGVSTDAAACSGAGTDALKAGGRAMDAAVVAALCLALVAPHRTSLDASGSLLYWEYRKSRTQQPTLVEWGEDAAGEARGGDAGAGPRGGDAGAGPRGGDAGAGPRGGDAGAGPRLLAALATLHALHGALPWARVLQPAIDLAIRGFPVSEGLAAAPARQAGAGSLRTAPDFAGSLRTAPDFAAYLQSLQRNTSAELSQSWQSEGFVRPRTATAAAGGAWRVYLGGAPPVRRALALALQPRRAAPDDAVGRVVAALQQEAGAGKDWPPAPGGLATGLAVVDSSDTYVALVTGLSAPSDAGAAGTAEGAGAAGGARPDLTPAIMLDGSVCGTRYVLAGASGAALAQAAAALAAGGDVERPRFTLLPGGELRPEGPGEGDAVNMVRQQQDALLSHADSRGGGLASRF